MKYIQTNLITALSIAIVLSAGCASTSQNVAMLEQTTPQTFTLPVNYIDAYANAKAYYQQCVAKSGISYPVTVYTNGTPVTVTNRTPDTTISVKLDRLNKSASLNVHLGSSIDQRVLFSEADEETTNVSFYAKKMGVLRSSAHRQKVQDEQVALLKQVSVNKMIECIK